MTLHERVTLERRLRRLPRATLLDIRDRLGDLHADRGRAGALRRFRGTPGDMKDLPPRLRGLVRRALTVETFDVSTGRRCG